MPRTIIEEAFKRVCQVLNRVQEVKCSNWDLHVPVVQWAYRTMYKTLTAKTILRLRNSVGTIIFEGHATMNPHIIAPAGATVHEAWDEEITQLCEVEHIRLQEAIWQGNLRLRKLEKYRYD